MKGSPVRVRAPAWLRQALSSDPSASGVRYALAHLDVLEGDRVGNHRRDPLAHGFGGVLRLEDDHRQSRVVLSCPVSSYEPWGLRYAGYHVLAQMAFGGLSVADRDLDDDCLHGDLLC